MASPSARESHLYHVFELIDRLFSTHTAAAATQEFRDFNIPEVNHLLRLLDCIGLDKKPKKPLEFSFRLHQCHCQNGVNCDDCKRFLHDLISPTPKSPATRTQFLASVKEFLRAAILAKFDQQQVSLSRIGKHSLDHTDDRVTEANASKGASGPKLSLARANTKSSAMPAPAASASHSMNLRSHPAPSPEQEKAESMAQSEDSSGEWNEVSSLKKKSASQESKPASAVQSTKARTDSRKFTGGNMISGIASASAAVDVYAPLNTKTGTKTTTSAARSAASGIQHATATSAAPPTSSSSNAGNPFAALLNLSASTGFTFGVAPAGNAGLFGTAPVQPVQAAELAVSAAVGCPNCAQLQQQRDDCLEDRARQDQVNKAIQASILQLTKQLTRHDQTLLEHQQEIQLLQTANVTLQTANVTLQSQYDNLMNQVTAHISLVQ